MKGITGGVLGPTGPTPLYPTPTGVSGALPIKAYVGVYLVVPTGTVYVAGSSGGCSTGAGFPLTAGDAPLLMPFDNPRQLHVLVPNGAQVRWLMA